MKQGLNGSRFEITKDDFILNSMDKEDSIWIFSKVDYKNRVCMIMGIEGNILTMSLISNDPTDFIK